MEEIRHLIRDVSHNINRFYRFPATTPERDMVFVRDGNAERGECREYKENGAPTCVIVIRIAVHSFRERSRIAARLSATTSRRY